MLATCLCWLLVYAGCLSELADCLFWLIFGAGYLSVHGGCLSMHGGYFSVLADFWYRLLGCDGCLCAGCLSILAVSADCLATLAVWL